MKSRFRYRIVKKGQGLVGLTLRPTKEVGAWLPILLRQFKYMVFTHHSK